MNSYSPYHPHWHGTVHGVRAGVRAGARGDDRAGAIQGVPLSELSDVLYHQVRPAMPVS
jgi:hypothetical protein